MIIENMLKLTTLLFSSFCNAQVAQIDERTTTT
jgi:hypothetical protein